MFWRVRTRKGQLVRGIFSVLDRIKALCDRFLYLNNVTNHRLLNISSVVYDGNEVLQGACVPKNQGFTANANLRSAQVCPKYGLLKSKCDLFPAFLKSIKTDMVTWTSKEPPVWLSHCADSSHFQAIAP